MSDLHSLKSASLAQITHRRNDDVRRRDTAERMAALPRKCHYLSESIPLSVLAHRRLASDLRGPVVVGSGSPPVGLQAAEKLCHGQQISLAGLHTRALKRKHVFAVSAKPAAAILNGDRRCIRLPKC